MSLRSINSSNLLKLLKLGVDPSELANDFVSKFICDAGSMNLQLIELMLKSCRLTCSIPQALIDNQVVSNIVEHLMHLVSSEAIDAERTVDVREPLLQKVLSFFEQFWFAAWNTTIEDGSVNFFFLDLIDAFSNLQINSIRNLSILVKLKLLTSIFQKRAMGYEQHLHSIIKSANTILRKALFDANRQLWLYSLEELEKWFSIFPELVIDEFLRFVVWAVRDDSLKIIHHGLKIVLYLFVNRAALLSNNFVEKVSKSLFNVVKIANKEIFSLFCECSLQVYYRFPDYMQQDLILYVEDHIFSTNVEKTEAAASFWVAVHCEGNSSVQCLREIVKFVQSRKSIFCELFVDVMVDTLPLMTDWKTLARCLNDDLEETLTEQEKRDLLMLILFAFHKQVYGKCAELRRESKSHELRNEDISIIITEAFKPYMKDLFSNPCFDMPLLLKIISYFQFDILGAKERESILNNCSLFFKFHRSTAGRRACLDLVYSVMIYTNDETVLGCCQNILSELKTLVENEFEKVFPRLVEKPDEFKDAEKGEELCSIMYCLLTLNSVLPIKKQISYISAIDLLQKPLPVSWNPAVLLAREILIALATKYVTDSLTSDAETCSREGLQAKIVSTKTLVSHLKSQCDFHHKGRIGETVFFSLCDLAVACFTVKEYQWLSAAAVVEFPIYLVAVLGGEDCNLTVARKKAIVERYLEMIELEVCPLVYAYDPLRLYCENEDEVFEDPLRLFIQHITEQYDTDTVVEWMFKFLMKMFTTHLKKVTERTLKMAEQMRNIVYMNKAKLVDVLIEVHKSAINFAVSDENNMNFLLIMTQFSSCLRPSNQKKIRDFLLAQETGKVKVASLYLESLKYQGKVEIDLSTLSISPSSIRSPEFPSSLPEEEESSNSDGMDVGYEVLNSENQSTILRDFDSDIEVH